MEHQRGTSAGEANVGDGTIALIQRAAERLEAPDDPGFAEAFDRFGTHRVVLLGEASHGTSDFYRARAAVTRRLVERHGFTLVAVEADWPDAAVLNQHVRHLPPRKDAPPAFQRFPTWMWRNTDFAQFVTWLRAHNAGQPPVEQAGLYGLDMYSMGASIDAVVAYLQALDPEAASAARRRYGCLSRWQEDPATYGHAVVRRGHDTCEEAVVRQCRELLAKRFEYAAGDGEAFLDAAQNARLVTSAERYYRVMYEGGADSWNLRDTHMFETLEHLLEAHGPQSKAVVWAHNSHIGDARHTAMGRERHELNIGQLCRDRFGADAALVGFGTHTGTVAAASDWGDPVEIMRVQPSRRDSVERLFHDTGIPRLLVDFRDGANPALASALDRPLLERFIGVIYRPATELYSHYAKVWLPRQFDAYVWFDNTSAVTPLQPVQPVQPVQDPRSVLPDTWPWGV